MYFLTHSSRNEFILFSASTFHLTLTSISLHRSLLILFNLLTLPKCPPWRLTCGISYVFSRRIPSRKFDPRFDLNIPFNARPDILKPISSSFNFIFNLLALPREILFRICRWHFVRFFCHPEVLSRISVSMCIITRTLILRRIHGR